jgi:hypothetical protein
VADHKDIKGSYAYELKKDAPAKVKGLALMRWSEGTAMVLGALFCYVFGFLVFSDLSVFARNAILFPSVPSQVV